MLFSLYATRACDLYTGPCHITWKERERNLRGLEPLYVKEITVFYFRRFVFPSMVILYLEFVSLICPNSNHFIIKFLKTYAEKIMESYSYGLINMRQGSAVCPQTLVTLLERKERENCCGLEPLYIKEIIVRWSRQMNNWNNVIRRYRFEKNLYAFGCFSFDDYTIQAICVLHLSNF